ncbi:ent-kaurene oxidase [Hypoxylon sp. NC1633]|nr:ent-kaurene oxidase [Hypoxylon sp. NC1633]
MPKAQLPEHNLLFLAPMALTAILIIALIFFIGDYRGAVRNRFAKLWAPRLGLDSCQRPQSSFFISILSIFKTRSWVFEGYARFSKAGSFFLLETLDRGKFLIIPPKYVKEIYSLPESVLDVTKTADESIQTAWTVWDDLITDVPLHMHVVRNQITRNLGLLTPAIGHELKKGFEREWGTSTTQWKSIHPWTTALRITAGAANAAFCGPPLCSDMEFLERLGTHAMVLFMGSIVISATPKPVRFITGHIIGWTIYFLLQRIMRIAVPVVQQRLDNTARLRADPSHPWVPPDDGLQWIIDEAYAGGDPRQLEVKRLTHRLIFVNDISMHSTGYTASNVIRDLVRQDPSFGYIEALRHESSKVLNEAGGSWTRQAVAQLHLVDSTIRESMRLSPFFSAGLPRTVIRTDGVTIDHDGSTHILPRGTLLGLPVEAIHRDEAHYTDAESFLPFRFADPKCVRAVMAGAAGPPIKEQTEAVEGSPKTKTSATVDDTFLSFGFGKHACPGRFFALNELKIFVAHMVLHYDFEYQQHAKPNTTPFLWLNVPLSRNSNVRVRRRVASELS